MSRQPHYELVHSDAGWFFRFIASNGKQIARASEVYTRRRAAERAIELVAGHAVYRSPFQRHAEIRHGDHDMVEIVPVDERTP